MRDKQPRLCESDKCKDPECQGEENEYHCQFCGQTTVSWFNIPCCSAYYQWCKLRQQHENNIAKGTAD